MEKKNLRLERKKHRWQENRLAIVEAAEKVFAQKGFSLATVDDIAEEAQFSKATLYRYFKSKSEIFFEVILGSFDEVTERLKEIQKKEGTASEKLKEVIRFILHFYHDKKHISRIFMMEKSLMMRVFQLPVKERSLNERRHVQLLEHVKKKSNQIYRILSDIFAAGMKAGEFREMNVWDACFILDALLHGFYFKRLWHEKQYGLERSTELIQALFLYGIKKKEK